MRDQLKNIELVDNYLNGKLSAEEKAEFIKNLENSIELQQLVKTQKELTQAVQRKALKEEIKNIIKKNKGWNNSSKWLLGGTFLIIALGLFLFFFEKSSIKQDNHVRIKTVTDTTSFKAGGKDSTIKQNNPVVLPNTTKTISKPPYEAEIAFNGLSTWVKPDVQIFHVNPVAGATIEADDGTLVIVPSNAFIDKNNKLVTDAVQFEMVEALTLEDMVLYNLGTTADGKALETGGMLHFNFTCLGKEVKINPERPLYVEVPTLEVKKDMRVFEGEIINKKINWKNPKPLKKYLVNVDFNLLDFLPTGFEDTVKTLLPFKGQTGASQQFVDSLYYSLFLKKEFKSTKSMWRGDTSISIESISGAEIITATSDVPSASLTSQKINSEALCFGIDPISIKTIKTEAYSKTFIATKEFAERVIGLHKLEKGNELLQLYINNLSRNMSYVDSLIVKKLGNKNKKVFDVFAAQELTNIKDAQIYQDKLSAYYNKKHKEYKKSAEDLQTELNKKNEAELNQLVNEYKNYINIAKAKQGLINQPALASQLPKGNVATNSSYSFQWAASGWVNIDSYLHLLSKGSEELSMTISNAEGTTEVYQWLNTINNLTPLVQNGQIAKALFPMRNSIYAKDMKNTFCFAISRKEGEYKWFDLRYNPYEIESLKVVLEPSTLPEIRKKLKMYDVKNDLVERLNKVEEQAIKIQNQRKIQLAEMKKHKEQLKLISIKLEQIKRENQVIEKLRSVAFLCGKAKGDNSIEY